MLAFSALLAAAVGGSTTYAVHDLARSRAREATVPDVAVRSTSPVGGFVAFRHTGADREYGVVATVPLADPDGARAFTGAVCDRVDATRNRASCLRTEAGVVTRFVADDLDADWRVVASTPLPGAPSRTRLSPDGRLVATTAFVTGHSYVQVGFSTATVVREPGGAGGGDLEDFTLTLDGEVASPADRNVWGVTFADDDVFYATLATGGVTHLVRGSLTDRTLTGVAEGVECPSLSPDGSRIAFKQATTVQGRLGWAPAVLDLATGERRVLAGEARSVDDQLEWLDDDTVLYGLARLDEAGVSDVWSLGATPDATPELFIAQAWSPSVVR